MRKRIRGYLIVFFLSGVFLSMLFFIQNYLEGKIYCNVRLQGEISEADITSEALSEFTIWEEESGIIFSNPLLQKSCKGECVYIIGEPVGLQQWNLVDGTLFLDEEGVIISERAAQQLYHSSYVVGQELEYGTHVYEIRGVVQDEKNTIYLLGAFMNPDNNSYRWTSSVIERRIAFRQVCYSISRKNRLGKNVTDLVTFHLEKNGYPQIDMLSYWKY